MTRGMRLRPPGGPCRTGSVTNPEHRDRKNVIQRMTPTRGLTHLFRASPLRYLVAHPWSWTCVCVYPQSFWVNISGIYPPKRESSIPSSELDLPKIPMSRRHTI
ncbi:hypothetical protein J6590_013280 [Homalodisca vitripennis]|nr:hypothetical protein J6590_013280 [Homalodisca vitripennis]